MVNERQHIVIDGGDRASVQTVGSREGHLWHQMTSEVAWKRDPGPVIARALGAFLWNTHGARIIDGNSGLQNVQIGHGRAEMAEAASAQIRQLDYFPTYNATHVVAEQLADALYERLPACERFFLANSGSEAIEVAIKILREYWLLRGETERTAVVARRGSYHGATLGALAATGISQLRQPFAPLLLRSVAVSDPIASDGETEHAAALRLAHELRTAIEQCGPEQILGVIAEPIQLWDVPIPPAGYWSEVRAVCDAFDLPLVADEIITGFGRTGRWFGLDHWDTQADVTVLGKGLASGYAPISAVGVGRRICDVFDADASRIFHHISTTAGHPMACRLALENIRILAEEDLVQRAHVAGMLLRRHLCEAFGDRSYVSEIRGLGLLNTVILDSAWASSGELRAARNASLRRMCLDAGAYLRVDGQIWFIPPLITDDATLQSLVEIALKACDSWARKIQG